MKDFIPLSQALEYGHTERVLNKRFERTATSSGPMRYSRIELEYTKRTGEYPSFPLDGWGNKPFNPERNWITNYPKLQKEPRRPLGITSMSGSIVNGIRLI